jgi:hypothetical protein
MKVVITLLKKLVQLLFVIAALQAEDKSDLTLVAKSNSMRKSAKEKAVELSTVLKLLADTQQELLNM